MDRQSLTKKDIGCHSHESGNPENIINTGFPLSRE